MLTFNTQGNAQDFGDWVSSFYRYARASSRTRGLFAGGQPGSGKMKLNSLLLQAQEMQQTLVIC